MGQWFGYSSILRLGQERAEQTRRKGRGEGAGFALLSEQAHPFQALPARARAASAPGGILLEMQILRPQPRPTESEALRVESSNLFQQARCGSHT